MKKNVTIRIDSEVIEKAKKIGLNISKISENALIEIIQRIERPISHKQHNNSPESPKHKDNLGATAGIWTRVKGLEGLCPRPG